MEEHPRINASPIGVFDSGYGGLTILDKIRKRLRGYDYIYLGDNARAPYGTRSFDVVYQFTLEAVRYLFSRGCRLVILACNTASAKALRTIQQNDLPKIDPERRVLGVIRPTVESLGNFGENANIGVLATPGTIASQSYNLEIAKLFPQCQTFGQECTLWATIIEEGETETAGAAYFFERDLQRLLAQSPDLDAIILGCTHYPLIKDKLQHLVPPGIKLIEQGEIVAESLEDYLRRHPEIEKRCSTNGTVEYLTTEDPARFNANASRFLNEKIESKHITIKQSSI